MTTIRQVKSYRYQNSIQQKPPLVYVRLVSVLC